MKGTIFALAGAVMLAGCGGGGKTASMTPTPTRTVLAALPEGHSLESGTIPVGRSRTIYESGGVRVVATCTGADCAIEVSDNGVATVTGGRVTISVTGPTGTVTDPPATPGTPTPGTSTPVPVVGDLPTPEGVLSLPSEGGLDLWEGSGSSLVWLDPDSPLFRFTRGPFAYEFLAEPLSFIGTYEGKAFLNYKGTDFLYTGTASMYYDGGDIDVTINIPGEFNHTWEGMRLYSNNIERDENELWQYDTMRVEGNEYGYAFDTLGTIPHVHGLTSGSTAGGYFGMYAGYAGSYGGRHSPNRAVDSGLVERGTVGRGGWGVSYSGSSRTPAPELSHCSTDGRKRYYCR